jgi:hypothetical protein
MNDELKNNLERSDERLIGCGRKQSWPDIGVTLASGWRGLREPTKNHTEANQCPS